MVEPAPGRIPTMKPTNEPLTNAKRQSFMSCQVGSRFFKPFGTGSMPAGSCGSMLARTSPIAKIPMATTMKSMPPSSAV